MPARYAWARGRHPPAASSRADHSLFSRAAPSQSNENIAPAVIMSLAKEMKKLCQEPLDGIKVLMNDEDVTDVNAEISGPGARTASSHRRLATAHARLRRRPVHNFASGAAPARARWLADTTPFEGGVFKVKLVLPSDYPSSPPKGAQKPNLHSKPSAPPSTRRSLTANRLRRAPYQATFSRASTIPTSRRPARSA